MIFGEWYNPQISPLYSSQNKYITKYSSLCKRNNYTGYI